MYKIIKDLLRSRSHNLRNSSLVNLCTPKPKFFNLEIRKHYRQRQQFYLHSQLAYFTINLRKKLEKIDGYLEYQLAEP